MAVFDYCFDFSSLKIHLCRCENLPVYLCSYKNKWISKIRVTTYEFKSTSYELKSTSYEFNTRVRRLKAQVARLKAQVETVKPRVR